MRRRDVDLALHLLDDQLIDADGKRCGRVDDLELEGYPGPEPRVAALLMGPAAWPARLPQPFDRLLRPLVPKAMHVLAWDKVADVTTTVKLDQAAAQLGLGTDDGRHVRWVHEPTPGRLRLSAILGKPVVTRSGRKLGRAYDVRAERQREPLDDTVDEPWIVRGLLIGGSGLLRRLGVPADERGAERPDPTPSRGFVDWGRVDRIDGEIVVRD
jgi:sporulation protein YlmC with PRC-barrel domain